MKLIIVSLAILTSGVVFAQPRRPVHVPGRLIVQERAGADPDRVSRAFLMQGTMAMRRIPQIGHHVLQIPEARVDRAIESLLDTGLFTFVERDGIAVAAGVPNDAYFASQWHLATIQAPSAWNSSVGSAAQPIAIVDSGIDATHPDLASRIMAGWNFLSGNTDTHDQMGHGSAVSGTVAAATNNLTGVAGVTWANPIMPLVVVDSTGYASYSNIASAITYAADHGARIINISLIGTSPSSALQSAVNYAWNKGSVVFAAAGNSGSSTLNYPAACDNVVAVSATEATDTLASFSNYGSWIDLSAPGNNILTTTNGGGYGSWWGTSFASPIAAGVGALALAARPSLSASALVSLLEANSDDLGVAGFDTSFGWGRVNAYKAVSAALAAPVNPPPSVAISAPSAGSTVSGTVTVSGAASDSLGISSVKLYCDGVLVSSTTNASFAFGWNAGTAAGTHTLSVAAQDPAGNTGTASLTVTVAPPPPPVNDTTPPTVQITSPAGGPVTGNGSINVSAAAQDNVRVTQVCIYLDGTQSYCGSAAPYSYQWNPKKASSGTHLITAKAWDAAGNVGVAAQVSIVTK
jgi:subtilisin family serine protease